MRTISVHRSSVRTQPGHAKTLKLSWNAARSSKLTLTIRIWGDGATAQDSLCLTCRQKDDRPHIQRNGTLMSKTKKFLVEIEFTVEDGPNMLNQVDSTGLILDALNDVLHTDLEVMDPEGDEATMLSWSVLDVHPVTKGLQELISRAARMVRPSRVAANSARRTRCGHCASCGKHRAPTCHHLVTPRSAGPPQRVQAPAWIRSHHASTGMCGASRACHARSSTIGLNTTSEVVNCGLKFPLVAGIPQPGRLVCARAGHGGGLRMG